MDSDKDFNSYSINLADLEDTLTLSSVSAPSSSYGSTDTITLGGSIVNGGVTLTSPYTIGTGFSNTTYGIGSPWMPTNSAPKIQLDGEDADITVNGWSLVAAVKSIEERLGLYQPNPELESEWAELRELSLQYKKLEQHIRDKQATWDRLKAMPAPDID
jgi:hypothetical protein